MRSTADTSIDDPVTVAEAVDLVVFDADDTLWKSEDYFRDLSATFADIVTPFARPDIDVAQVLHRIEVGNVAVTGYGVAAYTLSMVQAAVAASDGTIPADRLDRLVRAGYHVLTRPVEVLPGVVEALDAIGSTHPIAVITKGDLLHQRRKLEHSGLSDRFVHTRVVREKDVFTYRTVFDEWSVDPSSVLMIGNSMRSDVLPVVELGGYGVHIPYHVTWAHEVVHDPGDHHTELAAITEVDRWFRTTLVD